MPNTTTRLGLTQPIGSDNPSLLRTSITADTNTLDNAAMYSEGTLANLPGTPSPTSGAVYRATDADQLFLSSGSAWFGVARAMTLATSNVAATVGNWQFLTMTGATTTATLPASPPVGMICGVITGVSIGGAAPVTVSAGANTIDLPGATTPVSNITLGYPGAYVLLMWGGLVWRAISGGEDTGWVSLSLGTNISAYDSLTPSCRRINGEIKLRGGLLTGATISANTTLATIPTGFRPSGLVILNSAIVLGSGNASGAPLLLNGSGNNGFITTAQSLPNVSAIALNGTGFSLT